MAWSIPPLSIPSSRSAPAATAAMVAGASPPPSARSPASAPAQHMAEEEERPEPVGTRPSTSRRSEGRGRPRRCATPSRPAAT